MTTEPTLTETYRFSPAWFKGIGDGSIRDGIKAYRERGHHAAYTENDDENHAIYWVEGMLFHLFLSLVLSALKKLGKYEGITDQVNALRTHEAAHEPILGEEYPPLGEEERSDDGGLKHVEPQGVYHVNNLDVPYGDVMIRKGIRSTDERGLMLGYHMLEDEGRIARRVEVFSS